MFLPAGANPEHRHVRRVSSISEDTNSTPLTQSRATTTSKSYSRAIRNYTDWAQHVLSGVHREIVTPRRLLAFLQYIDSSKRKSNGDRYSFSFYEQHVSSLVILYERQKMQYVTRPKIDETGSDDGAGQQAGQDGVDGVWEHPRDKAVRHFLKMVKRRARDEMNGHAHADRIPAQSTALTQSSQQHSSQQQQHQQQHQQSPSHQHQHQHQQQQRIPDSRLDSIEEHLKMQADSLTRTTALLSLYHNDLTERSGHSQGAAQAHYVELTDKYESLAAEMAELKKMTGFLIGIENENQDLLKKLLQRQRQQQQQSVVSPPEDTMHDISALGSSHNVNMRDEVGVEEDATPAPVPQSPPPPPPAQQQQQQQPMTTTTTTTTEIQMPKITLRDTKDLSVANLYDEYINGYLGQPSLREMEARYKTKWRVNEKSNKTIMRRLKVAQAIEYTSGVLRVPAEDMIKELDDYLASWNGKKRSTYWLSENLPPKFTQTG